MEHIVQFAIGIDDDKIRERVVETAEKQIIKDIEQQVRNQLFEHRYYGQNADEKSPLNEYSKRIIDKFLEKHKDEILEKTVVYLAEKLARSKRGREVINKVEEAQ